MKGMCLVSQHHLLFSKYAKSWISNLHIVNTPFFYLFLCFYFSIIVDSTLFCQFLLYSKVTQSYIYICIYAYMHIYIYAYTFTHIYIHIYIYIHTTHTYIYTFLFLTLSSIMFYHKWLDIVPSATQQDLIAYLLPMQ